MFEEPPGTTCPQLISSHSCICYNNPREKVWLNKVGFFVDLTLAIIVYPPKP